MKRKTYGTQGRNFAGFAREFSDTVDRSGCRLIVANAYRHHDNIGSIAGTADGSETQHEELAAALEAGGFARALPAAGRDHGGFVFSPSGGDFPKAALGTDRVVVELTDPRSNRENYRGPLTRVLDLVSEEFNFDIEHLFGAQVPLARTRAVVRAGDIGAFRVEMFLDSQGNNPRFQVMVCFLRKFGKEQGWFVGHSPLTDAEDGEAPPPALALAA